MKKLLSHSLKKIFQKRLEKTDLVIRYLVSFLKDLVSKVLSIKRKKKFL